MQEERPDSEQLLKRLKYEEREQQKKSRGRLKIFLGYAAGSGKTYAMLEAAHEAKNHGIDVAVGYIEPHDRPDTQALTEGLELLPPFLVEYKGLKLREFDLDGALKRKPQLILVDELAHTNGKGCRTEKRYQDIKELLRAGVNVYTTLNIQHLESLNDLVGNITHIDVRERIPDTVFDHADQVEVIDIEPEELIERMKEGKIYRREQADRALQNFFRREKLAALREIALRRCADRVNRIAEEERSLLERQDYHTGEHILVCITAAPSSAKVIRTASRLAYAFHGTLTGLCVETPDTQEAGEKTKEALRNNMELAKLLGAKIVTVFGSDVAAQIAQYAIVSNVSKIVLGRTNHFTMRPMYRSELLEKLTYMAPNIDVYIIPDMRQTKRWHPRKSSAKKREFWKKSAVDLAEATVIMLIATVMASILRLFVFSEANTIMIYLMGVLLASYTASRKLCALYSALLSVILFNFFFTEPLYSLKAYEQAYPLTFLLLFLAGLFTATVTGKLKRQNMESSKTAYRTGILLENSQKLRRCKTKDDVWKQAAVQSGKLLNLSILLYPVKEAGAVDAPLLFPRKGMELEQLKRCVNVQEKGVAQWAASNRRRAGACTHTLPDAMAMYLPIQDEEQVYAVMGIYLEERRPVAEFEYSLLTAMLNETGVKLKDLE